VKNNSKKKQKCLKEASLKKLESFGMKLIDLKGMEGELINLVL